MAKSKEKKPKPKPNEELASVKEIRKAIDERKKKVADRKTAATKDGKFNKYDGKYRVALKRLKRSYRKLGKEASRTLSRAKPAPAAAAAAPAEEKKEG